MKPSLKFLAWGLNHTTAPVEVREKYALEPERAAEVLRGLKEHAPEGVFLSTCNRVEFYLAADDLAKAESAALKLLHGIHKPKGENKKYFYSYEGPQAFLHLFRVASSLDSMVLGEAQILGQVKEAYESSREKGMTGTLINGVFARAFSAAKKVRSQTDIARMPTNVSSVAVDLAKKIFRSMAETKVLLLGAGEMSELTAKYLVDGGVKNFFVANRTLEKAKGLAHYLGGQALTLDQGFVKLSEVDIVIASVGGSFVLGRGEVEKALKARSGRSLFIIDIGVPRNVEPEVGKLDSVYLYNIDNLSAIANENKNERQKAVMSAESILQKEVEDLCSWLSSLELVPAITKLRDHYESVRQREVADFLSQSSHLSERDRKAIERLTKNLTGKLLHEPTVNLKSIENEVDRFEFARMLNEIFGLHSKSESKGKD